MTDVSGLTRDQIKQFRDQGYLVVEDVIDVERYLDPLVAEYGERLDEIVAGLAGSLPSNYEGLPFGSRLTRLYADTGRSWAQHFDFSLPFKGVKPDEPCHFGPAVFAMLRNDRILDVVESLIGPEIYSNPVQHVRLKPPQHLVPSDPRIGKGLLGATEWHQDASVVVEEADNTEILTVWIPLVDVDERNGCLCVVPRNHKRGLLQHCIDALRGKYLPTAKFDADRAKPLPMRRGSILVMDKMTPHSSLENKSDDVRVSMDLRFNPVGQPTGRPEFPGFVARSRRDPAAELRDPLAWEESWLATRERMSAHPELVPAFTRWREDAPGCA